MAVFRTTAAETGRSTEPKILTTGPSQEEKKKKGQSAYPWSMAMSLVGRREYLGQGASVRMNSVST